MNPVVKTKWLEALRSGRFQQARGRMRVSKRSSRRSQLESKFDESSGTSAHCCLGVLTEVALEEGAIIKWETARKHNVMPSKNVYAWAELDKADADDLASLNDKSEQGTGVWPSNTFEKIAVWIEQNL